MSSRQFNYYGSDTDWQIVESSIRDVLGPLAVFDESGAAIELKPVESRRAMFVTTDTLAQALILSGDGTKTFVDYRRSPVLEFVPAFDDDRGTHVGRLASFFHGNEEFSKLVQKLFRRLKRQAQRIPHSAKMRILPDAAINSMVLIPWVGPSFRNPLLADHKGHGD